LGAVVVVVALIVDVVTGAIVVVTGAIVVVTGDEPVLTIASSVTTLGNFGVTPAGSNAIATLMYWANLIDAGLVVIVGLV
jgi:hypothetical protein